MGEPYATQCVVFDMDGVIIDSEPLWAKARQDLVRDVGGRWLPEAATAMMGVSSAVWSVYMRDRLRVPLTAPEIRAEVITRMIGLYRRSLPVIPGALHAVRAVAGRWRTGVASGSDRVLLDTVLSVTGLDACVAATVAGEEVAEGKPSPIIYQEACRRLGVAPRACLAVEDSGAGISSALAAGMKVIAIPRPGFEPDPVTLARATVVLPTIEVLTGRVVADVLAGDVGV